MIPFPPSDRGGARDSASGMYGNGSYFASQACKSHRRDRRKAENSTAMFASVGSSQGGRIEADGQVKTDAQTRHDLFRSFAEWSKDMCDYEIFLLLSFTKMKTV